MLKENQTDKVIISKRRRKVKTVTLNRLERDILYLFLTRKRDSLSMQDIAQEFYIYGVHTLLRAIVRLCEHGILLVLSDLTVVLDNIPLLLQTFLRFKRNTTAYLLYFLFKENEHAIKVGKEARLDEKMFILPRYGDTYTVDIFLLYYKKNKMLYNAIGELKERNLLTYKRKNVYIFNYKILDPLLLDFLLCI